MNENENIITMPEDDDVLLPDGWAEGDDIFAEEEWTGETGADESGEDPAQESEEGMVDEDENPAPTTEQETPSDDVGAGKGEAPTTEQVPAAAANRLKFKARVDREDLDVEVDESELPTLYQKAQVTDRVQAKLAKVAPTLEKAETLARSLGYDNLDAMLASASENYQSSEVKRLVGEGVHEEVAKDMVARKMATAAQRGQAEVPAEDRPAEESAPTSAATARDFQAEAQELLRERPDLRGKTLPQEVVNACVKGNKNLLVAYAEYEARQEKAEAERLRKENDILKQNAASAAKAPVKGATGGGATDTKPRDPFEEGFDSDYY